jgi:hypothetical protein
LRWSLESTFAGVGANYSSFIGLDKKSPNMSSHK